MIYLGKNVVVVGTSHVSKSSKKIVKNIITSFQPDIVMIELCEERLKSLLKKKRDNYIKWIINNYKHLGIGTAIFVSFMRFFQKFIGKKLGIEPGAEMITAYRIAKRNNIDVALIDMPFSQTIYLLSKSVKLRSIIKLFIISLFTETKTRSKGAKKIDLSSFLYDPQEEEVEEAKKIMKKYFPDVYKVLIQYRNRYMLEQINIHIKRFTSSMSGKNKTKSGILENIPKIMVVVGAGHAKEIYEGAMELMEKSKN